MQIDSPTPNEQVRGTVTVTATFDEPITKATLFGKEGTLWKQRAQKIVSPAAYTASLTFDSSKDSAGVPLPEDTFYTLRMNAQSQATGANIANAPTVTVVTHQGPSAALTVIQSRGTNVALDASGSVGAVTYAAEIDGVPLAMTGPQARVSLKLGGHHFKLTVTDANGLSAVVEQDFVSIWQGWDEEGLHHARAVAGDPSPGIWIDPTIHPEGPWDTLGAVMDESDPRLNVNSRGASYKLKYGDQPQPGGGNRIISSIVPTMAHPDWQGNEIDTLGNDGTVRFMRYRCRFPAANPDSLDHGNTFVEARSDGDMIFTAIPQGTHYTCYARGNRALEVFPYVKDQWEDLLWEWVFSTDPAVGYIRLYKDGVCVTTGIPSADGHIDPDGKVFLATKPAATSKLLVAAKFYRSSLWGDLGDWFLDFENVAIGRSYNDVMPVV